MINNVPTCLCPQACYHPARFTSRVNPLHLLLTSAALSAAAGAETEQVSRRRHGSPAGEEEGGRRVCGENRGHVARKQRRDLWLFFAPLCLQADGGRTPHVLLLFGPDPTGRKSSATRPAAAVSKSRRRAHSYTTTAA